jgi:hypothetical protein
MSAQHGTAYKDLLNSYILLPASLCLPERPSAADVMPGTAAQRPAGPIFRKRPLHSPGCRCTLLRELPVRQAPLHSHRSIRPDSRSVLKPRSSGCLVPGTEEGANLAVHS